MSTIAPTPKALLGALLGKEAGAVTDSALTTWQRKLDSMSAVRRAQVYTDLVARLSELQQDHVPFDRYVEEIAEIREGDGSQIYLLTGIDVTEGEIYNPEFNSSEASKFLFGMHKPALRQFSLAQVRDWTKAVTVQDQEIRAANWAGLVEVANRLTDSLRDSDYLSEYRLVASMLFDAVRREIAHEVTVPSPTDGDTSRNWSAFIGGLADWMSKPSSRYNPARMTQATRTEDVIIVTRSTTWQQVAKQQYSQAFNPEYMRGLSDRQYVTIPDEMWPEDLADVSAIVISKAPSRATLTIVDNEITESATVNDAWGRVNHGRLHRSVFGVNPMAALVVVKNGAEQAVGGAVPVPDTVTLSIELNGNPVNELHRGSLPYRVVVNVADENGFAAGRADVTLTGSTSATERTWIGPDDLNLYVGWDEEATSLTITATSVIDPTKTAALTLPVVGDLFPGTPPYEPVQVDADDDGDFEVHLTPSMIATFSGNTATPPAADSRYTLAYAGTVGTSPASGAFTAPVTLTDAGDEITITATAETGYELTGTTTRTLTYS